MYDAINAKIIVDVLKKGVKIIQAEDDRKQPYMAAGCGSCDEMGHLIYNGNDGKNSEWICRQCGASYGRPSITLSSVCFLDSGYREDWRGWVAAWCCFPVEAVEVKVELK